jgi:hypothetical protein
MKGCKFEEKRNNGGEKGRGVGGICESTMEHSEDGRQLDLMRGGREKMGEAVELLL